MRHELKVSRLAMVCVLFAAAVCPAFGAASVRSLGGAGTYSSASSAATAKTSVSANKSTGGAAARAGSMRVSPSVTNTTRSLSTGDSAATSGASSARAAASPRLSIGKYLGGGVSVSGGSSIKNQAAGAGSVVSGSATPGLAADLDALNKRVDDIDATVAAMYDRDELKGELETKQDVLTPKDEIVVVDGGDIYLDVDNLSNAVQKSLEEQGATLGAQVEIDADDNGIKWRQGDGEWVYLAAWDKLTGPQGEKGEPGAGVDAATLNAAVDTAVVEATAGFLTSADLPTKVSELENDAGYLIADDIATTYATKEELKAAQLDGDVNMDDYAKKEYVDNAVSGKADKTALDTLSGGVAEISDQITTVTTTANNALTTATTAGAAASQAQNTADAAMAAVGNKADASALADYAKKTDVATTYATKDELKSAQLGGDVNIDDYAKKEYVDNAVKNKADKTELEKYAETGSLGALATANTVGADQIENGAVTSDKLADSVKSTLENVVSTADVDMTKNQVLAIYDGKQTWLEIVE